MKTKWKAAKRTKLDDIKELAGWVVLGFIVVLGAVALMDELSQGDYCQRDIPSSIEGLGQDFMCGAFAIFR